MKATRYRVLDPQDVATTQRDEFAFAVLQGLSGRPKRLSSRFLYDDAGSSAFQEIMHLEEYYPTRCEAEILERHASKILERFADRELNLVDLGAGDGAKTMILLRELDDADAAFRFVPIDISKAAMESLSAIVEERAPKVEMCGIVADYTTGLSWLGAHSGARRNLVLFLGSNIGNFNKAQARSFLRRLWSSLNDDDYVLIGFDLKKDIELLLAAYNDSKGVTARFNKNLLARINAELGGDFDLDKFRHYSTYDVFTGAMESYLVSLADQRVLIKAIDSRIDFEAWEPIHTEYSYKYLERDVDDLASATGFSVEESFYDSRRYFMCSLWRVDKSTA